MGAQSTPLFTKTRQAGGAITKRRFVGFDDQQAGVAGEATLGVARSDAVAGDHHPVDMLGTTVVEAGGVVAVGYVMTDAQGRAVTFTAAAGTHAAGIAMEASTGTGDFIEVFLLHNAPQ